MDGVRFTGDDNKKLKLHARAKRFTKYIQECCNMHHGKDMSYIRDTFLKQMPKKRPRASKKKKV